MIARTILADYPRPENSNINFRFRRRFDDDLSRAV